jgi:hypothetical protein
MVKMDANPELWEISVLQELEQTIPWIMPYVKGVVFKDADAARGAGFGYVVLANGEKSAGIILIVRELELLPLDVFEADEVLPLTERRVMDVLGTSSPFKSVLTKPEGPRSTNIANQIRPPMDAARPNTDMVVHGSCQDIFRSEPTWDKNKMIAGPGWAFSKYSSYIKAEVDPEDAKARVVSEYLDRKEL